MIHRPSRTSGTPALRRGARVVAVAVSVALVMTTLGVPSASAKPTRPRMLSAQHVPSTDAIRVQALPRPRDMTQGVASAKRPPVVWPSPATADVEVTTPVTGPERIRSDGREWIPVWVRAGTLPVRLAAAGSGEPLSPSRVRVRLLARASVPTRWRDGVVLALTRIDGSGSGRVTVGVDYAAFAGAVGGDWAARLRLVHLPACALTTPGSAGCQAMPLPSRNDATRRQVSADVSVAGDGPTLLALTSGPSGSAGDFTASSLQASSSWSAGGSSGSFSWSYPMRVPPSLGGPAPVVGLAYSSAAVDGRSEATNNQPSWLGEGFDWWPGFIERGYRSCAEDMAGSANNTTATGDLCWGTDNANVSLNGSGGQLVKDDTTGTWRLRGDDGSKVERLTNTVNGDNNNEYWKVTTSDGTQYFFGLNRLPGYTGIIPADKTTNATWTVPVAGNHPGEPCHAATFASSFCTQAWRWNLDYVVDPHGNTMSLFYTAETNRYARNNTDTDAASYVRGGWLDRIDYGTDNRSGADTVNTSTAAPMRVAFAVADRCLASCWTGSEPNKLNWTDTPWDQRCASAPCTGRYSPTFWTTKRLATVTTRVWNTSTATYKDIDAWTLAHTFPDPGDGTRAGLWLESIVHTGKATGPAITGGAVTLPEINFDWVQMPNRVDTVSDGSFPMNWMRLSTIWTETGGKIDIRYSGPDCIPGVRMPASPETNTLRCYPVVVQRPGEPLTTEYFHKYVVTDVTEADRTGGGPSVVTSYEYIGAPAWRHTDDDGMTKDNRRTWSNYRGYAQVNTRVGPAGSPTRTLTTTTYFRGMDGDLTGSGGTRTVTLPGIDLNGDGDLADVPPVNDSDSYAGMVRQTTVFNGVESEPISTTVYEPWRSPPTATRAMGQTTVHARHIATKTTWSGDWLGSGAWRVSRADATFDSYGMPFQFDDHGDVAVAGDEQCVKTTYARNTDRNLLTLAARVERHALRCATAPTSDADVIADTRTSFDGQEFGATPTMGDPTTVEVAKAWTPGGGPVWLTQTTARYDDYGRAVDVTDVRGNHTTTAYTPPSGGPIMSVATTMPLGTSTTILEPSWGTPTATVDINNKRTEASFDALGRTRQVWLANRPKAAFPTTPTSTYSYLVRHSGDVNAVTTATLNAASTAANAYYTTSYALFDGLLRPRQTQVMSLANGNVGTVFSETKYDDHGRAVSQSQYYDSTVQPGTDLMTVADWQPKSLTVTEYDVAGRATASIFRSSGVEKWRTTTIYGGGRVSVVPPQGGTTTTAVTDAHGRTVELRQYHDPSDVGSDTRSQYDLVSYHYDRKGHQDRITDNAGNTWTATADLLGRVTAAHDPDKGDASATYNDVGDLVTATDARGQTLAFEYDGLGRAIGVYAGSVAPADRLASWKYDPPGFKGQLASASRWLNNGTDEYRVKVRSYTPLYQSTGEDYIIPAVPATAGLSGTYTVSRGYTYDGSPATLTYPAAGGLNRETVTATYDAVTGLPEKLATNSGQGQYVSNTDYTEYGEVSFVQYQLLAGPWLQRAFSFDEATHLPTRAETIRQTAPQLVDDTRYSHDPSGNITKIATTAATGGTDTQCFDHDYARRLVDAWTPASGDCGDAKSVTALGGPAPYWLSWSFDPVGNRATETSHTTSGDLTSSYSYPAAGSAQPHAATSVTAGPATLTYRFDQIGNTTCRPAGTSPNTCPTGDSSQQLTWDAEGHLATLTNAAGTSTYTYTTDGARLLADDPTATTLYLPGAEITRTKNTGAVTATRYYTWAGQTFAMKSSNGEITWLINDHQGTQTAAIAAGGQTVASRRHLPYGAPRGSVSTWPNPKGFVGGDNDPTGLTHIGARDYDPATGRFLSVDPVLGSTEPQQMQGYGYANNSPATLSDPTGLEPYYDDGGRNPCGPYSSSNCWERYRNDYSEANDWAPPSPKQTTRNPWAGRIGAMRDGFQAAAANDPVGRFLAEHPKETAWFGAFAVCTVTAIVPGAGWAACGVMVTLAVGVTFTVNAVQGGGLANTWQQSLRESVEGISVALTGRLVMGFAAAKLGMLTISAASRGGARAASAGGKAAETLTNGGAVGNTVAKGSNVAELTKGVSLAKRLEVGPKGVSLVANMIGQVGCAWLYLDGPSWTGPTCSMVLSVTAFGSIYRLKDEPFLRGAGHGAWSGAASIAAGLLFKHLYDRYGERRP